MGSMFAVFWLLLAAFPCVLQAQPKSTHEITKPVRVFVQTFYDWYVPISLRNNSVPASDFALKYKSSDFSPELLRALQEDSNARAKVTGEVVGLDFDPFLNGQDPCQRYDVGEIAHRGASYWVDVYGICSGRKSQKPDVTAELVYKNGHWLFVNFHYNGIAKQYPQSADLVSILKLLRKDRERPSR